MEFEVRAKAKYIPVSPQKVRLVLDLVRDKEVDEALAILEFYAKAGSRPCCQGHPIGRCQCGGELRFGA